MLDSITMLTDPDFLIDVGVGGVALFGAVRALKATLVRTPEYKSNVIAGYGGQFKRSTTPGLSYKRPYPFERVAYTADLTLQVTDFDVNIKTNNDNFVDLPIQIHFEITDPIKSARLPDVTKRKQVMQTLAQNVIRGHFAEGDLQNVYTSRKTMADEVRKELQTNMKDYGLEIRDVVVENPKLPPDLQASMQGVSIADRNLEISRKQAEATKVRAVAEAEARQAVLVAEANGKKAQLLAQAEGEGAILIAKAEAEKKARTALGEGVAAEQIAIAGGVKNSVDEMKASGVSVEKAMAYIESLNNRQLERQIAERYADAFGNVKNAVLFADAPNHAMSGGDRVAGGAGVSSTGDLKELTKLVVGLQAVLGQTSAVKPGDTAQPK